MKRLLRSFFAASALLLLAGAAFAQNPNNENDLVLTNQIEIVYVYSDPSIGSPVGTFPPDWAGSDYFWKVVPKEALNHPLGSMEISGIDFFSFDTDYTTVDGSGNNTVLYDIILTTGLPSVANPGMIEPDPADPSLVALNFGAGTPTNNTFLPDPGCPPPGFVNGYQLEVQIGTGAGDGIIITADGTTDYVWTHMIPTGMCGPFGPCAGTGTCLDGDMALQDAHSSCLFGGVGETQADWLGTGYSAFGGFAIAGALATEPVCETAWTNTEFFERSVQGRVDLGDGNGPKVGLVNLHPSVGGGTSTYSYRLFGYQAIGDFAFVAGSIAPLLPAPGVPILGANVLLLPTDPVINITLKSGPVELKDFDDLGAEIATTGDPFDDGAFTSTGLPVPASVAGIVFRVQGFTLDIPTFTLTETQVFTTTFEP